MIEALPEDSALCREISPWSQTEHLLADLCEITDLWGRVTAVALGQPKSVLDGAIEIPRPGDSGEAEPPPAVKTMQSLLAERG